MSAAAPDAAPECSAVIVTWNRRKELQAAIASLLRQSAAARLEIIVIDNGSTDGTVEWLRSAHGRRVRLFQYGRNTGASVARNAGIRLARAPWVCFLDSDAEILDKGTLEGCLQRLGKPEAPRAVAVPVWFDRERTRPFALGGYVTPDGHFWGLRTRTERAEPHFISTCFAVWEKRLLEELRGFDPWYFWGIEDMDLGLRAWAAARRGEGQGATRFEVLDAGAVLHQMASGGRHYQPSDFPAAFSAYERQRLYLVLAYGGIREFLRVLLRGPFRVGRMERDGWEQQLCHRRRLAAAVGWPLWRLAMLPRDLFRQRRNFLARAPLPREVS